MLVPQAGWEAAGAAVARTHCRFPFRVRCNGRVGGGGGWLQANGGQVLSSSFTYVPP
jgi:hypothetical protein